jgi:hypothetical protein
MRVKLALAKNPEAARRRVLEGRTLPMNTLQKRKAQRYGELLVRVLEPASHEHFRAVVGRIGHDAAASIIICDQAVPLLAQAAIIQVRANDALSVTARTLAIRFLFKAD